MKKISLAIIGLGYIGMVHLRNCLRLSDANLVAVSDTSKKALKTAEGFGIKKIYADYGQLLKDPEIDAVVIALPTHLHLECARNAAEAGKHILLEKPMARNFEEAGEILSVTQKNGVKLMIGYPLRFNSAFRDIKETINTGVFGDIEYAFATYISSGPFFHRNLDNAPVPVPEWWFNKQLSGGGVLLDLGCHMINLLRWYFGEIIDVKSNLGYRYNLDFEDSALCVANFKSGTVGVINVGWFSKEYRLKVELLGSVSHVAAQNIPSNPLSTLAQILKLGTSKFRQAHRIELQYFVDCLMKDLSPSPSGEDGFRDLKVISQAYQNITNPINTA